MHANDFLYAIKLSLLYDRGNQDTERSMHIQINCIVTVYCMFLLRIIRLIYICSQFSYIMIIFQKDKADYLKQSVMKESNFMYFLPDHNLIWCPVPKVQNHILKFSLNENNSFFRQLLPPQLIHFQIQLMSPQRSKVIYLFLTAIFMNFTRK